MSEVTGKEHESLFESRDLQDGMTIRGYGYRINVSSLGLEIERLDADENCVLTVPLADLPGLGELVEHAYNEGRRRGWWA